MKYIWCPGCGHKLMDCSDGCNVQVKCSKCNRIINADVKQAEVTLTIVNEPTSNKQRAAN